MTPLNRSLTSNGRHTPADLVASYMIFRNGFDRKFAMVPFQTVELLCCVHRNNKSRHSMVPLRERLHH